VVAWCSLCGLAFVDKRCPKLPCDADLPALTTQTTSLQVSSALFGLGAVAEKLLLSVSRAPGNPELLPILMLFAIGYVHWTIVIRCSAGAEHFEWSTLFLLRYHVCPLGHTFRLLVVWLECRKILTTLDYFPLRRASGTPFAWDPIWRLGSGWGLELSRLVARQLETLEQLRRKVGQRGATKMPVVCWTISKKPSRRERLAQRVRKGQTGRFRLAA